MYTIKLILFIFSILDSVCENVTETPSTSATQTREPKEIAIGAPVTNFWQPYATLYSGTQAFYSPPSYGKRKAKPVEEPIKADIEAIGSYFNQKFSGFSDREPPFYGNYEDLQKAQNERDSFKDRRSSAIRPPLESMHDSIIIKDYKRNSDFHLVPPDRFRGLSGPYGDEFTPIRSPFKGLESNAYGSLIPGRPKDNIPTYIEPILSPFTEEEHKDVGLNHSLGDVYNLFVYNDMGSTETPHELNAIKQNEKPPKYPQNSGSKPVINGHHGVGDSMGVFQNNHFQSAVAVKDRRTRPLRRPFHRKQNLLPRRPRRRRRKHKFKTLPPLLPPRRKRIPYRGYPQKKPEDEQHWVDRFGPVAALATLIPVALILSAVTPTFFGKRKKRSTNGTFNALKKFRSKDFDEILCLQKLVCQVMIQEEPSAASAVIGKLRTYILDKLNANGRGQVGLKGLVKAIEKGECAAFKCKIV